jgi:NADH-quinone oxidoreductase subunit H
MYLLQVFDWWIVLEKFILIASIVTISLVVAMYSTYAERKIAAFLQDRSGPNRAGPFGLLQPVADGLKLFFKEEIIPTLSSKFLFILGPMLAMITATMTSAVIPWGSTIDVAGRLVPLQIADINIGVLYIFGVVSLGVYGIMIGGWASNNKFSLLAAVRGASQMISYELAMGPLPDCCVDDLRFVKNECYCKRTNAAWLERILPAARLFNFLYLCTCRM